MYNNKRILSIFIFITAFLIIYPFPCEAWQMPEKIRTGLYFNDSSVNMNTALSEAELQSESGFVCGIDISGSFIPLMEFAAGTIIVRKDYFLPEEDLGPYHIQLAGPFGSRINTTELINTAKNNGINAFTAYNGNWFVWAGFFKSNSQALKYIDSTVTSKLGNDIYPIVLTEKKGISISNESGQVLLVYSGDLPLRLRARDGSPAVIGLNGTFYRGDIEFLRNSESDMTVINITGFEEYLYGVVACEIEALAHAEALKAQAVAARTYAMKNINRYEKLSFNLCANTICQVYRGYTAEREATNRAVDETKGKIVTYMGTPAQTYYFSSSGGVTENVKNVWGSKIPYLVSVEDPFEKGDSWNYYWQKIFTSEDISRILKARQIFIGEVAAINILKTSEAGRATEIEITGSAGKVKFKNSDCRTVFNSLYSQLYTIKTESNMTVMGADGVKKTISLYNKDVITASGIITLEKTNNSYKAEGKDGVNSFIPSVPSNYIFTGRGWGHAVGMSQEGAKGMALAGYTYEQILMHYYRGTKVE